MDALIWLVLVIILTGIEIITLGLATIWFAGGALAACIVALCHGPLLLQVIVFLLVSIVLLLFTRPVAMRYLNKNRTKTNVDSLIGQEAVVLQEINNIKAKGTVRINGMEWTARTAEGQEIIPSGEVVTVMKIEGVKLIVQRKGE